MFKIPGRVYPLFARILGLPGSEALEGIQREIVPTQDLTRMLQGVKVKHTLYTLDTSPTVNANRDVQWNDASDWSEIQVNGVVTAVDAQLPMPTDDRIIIMTSLQISGTQADYSTAEVLRFLPTVAGSLMLVQSYGAIVAAHSAASPTGPLLLPQVLVPGEISIRLAEKVSGADADFFWSVHMISAERGVLSPYPGV